MAAATPGSTERPARPVRSRWLRALAWTGVALTLGLVFAAYRTPERVVDLADRVWAACFG